jgi:hypothetical protein
MSTKSIWNATATFSARVGSGTASPQHTCAERAPQSSPTPTGCSGERGLLCTVTPEACVRAPQSFAPAAHLWTGLGAGSLMWKAVSRDSLLAKPVTPTWSWRTGQPQPQNGPQIRVGSDRFRHVEEWRAKRGGKKPGQAADTRVTSTEMGPSVSIQLTSPVIRPTARRSGSTACRCASVPGVP